MLRHLAGKEPQGGRDPGGGTQRKNLEAAGSEHTDVGYAAGFEVLDKRRVLRNRAAYRAESDGFRGSTFSAGGGTYWGFGGW